MYEEGNSSHIPTGRVGKLDMFSTFEIGVGMNYFLEAGVIHRVIAIELPCVTMLTTEERDVPIFSYGTDSREKPFERKLANEREAGQIKTILNEIITQPCPGPYS